MKLQSMTDFVLEQSKVNISSDVFYFLCSNYAQFLKQPLTLGMFVPCVNNEPFNYSKHGNEEEYQQAKERVLFEFDGDINLIRNKDNFFIIEDKNGVYLSILKNNTKTTVETLFKFTVEITLTQSAIKQIGLNEN